MEPAQPRPRERGPAPRGMLGRTLVGSRWLTTMLRPYAGRLATALVATSLSGALVLVLPALSGRVVDAAVTERSLDRLEGVILGLLGVYSLATLVDYTETYLLRAVAAGLVRDLRRRVHAHLMTMSSAFFERERVGEILSRLSADVTTIQDFITNHLIRGLRQVLVLIGAVVVLVAMHARLTGVMLLAVPPVVIVAVVFGLRFERISREQQAAAADANVAAEESLAGIRTVQAFSREADQRARYDGRLVRMLRLALREARAWGALHALVSFFSFAALSLVLWTGGKLVIRGELSAGDLTAFLLYTSVVAVAVGTVTSAYGGLGTTLGATERLRDLLATPSTIVDPPQVGPRPDVRGDLTFERVRFAYPANPENPAVADVSLEIAAGEVIALVGASGAGKSTLASLLLRFHDPQSGVVRLDGVDVKRLRLADLREAIGLVPQDVFLFGGTVAENIRFGRPDATDADVRAAAERSQTHDFIAALPDAYETMVGERGVLLSAGQRQRIAIARVFLKDPRVVVLDEATSALDADSEHRVQHALHRLFEGRTTLVIAHRLATVRRADRVVLLDRGAIAAQGAHDRLLERSEFYRHLCELQLLDARVVGATP